MGFSPVPVLFLEGRSCPVDARDVKDIITHGEPGASLSVFALLLALVTVLWFPCVPCEFVVTVPVVGSLGREGVRCQRAGVLGRGVLEHSFPEHIPHSLGVPACGDF